MVALHWSANIKARASSSPGTAFFPRSRMPKPRLTTSTWTSAIKRAQWIAKWKLPRPSGSLNHCQRYSNQYKRELVPATKVTKPFGRSSQKHHLLQCLCKLIAMPLQKSWEIRSRWRCCFIWIWFCLGKFLSFVSCPATGLTLPRDGNHDCKQTKAPSHPLHRISMARLSNFEDPYVFALWTLAFSCSRFHEVNCGHDPVHVPLQSLTAIEVAFCWNESESHCLKKKLSLLLERYTVCHFPTSRFTSEHSSRLHLHLVSKTKAWTKAALQVSSILPSSKLFSELIRISPWVLQLAASFSPLRLQAVLPALVALTILMRKPHEQPDSMASFGQKMHL